MTRTSLLPGLLLLAVASPVGAQDSGGAPITPEQIDGWIRDLDNDDFKVRDEATKSLAEGGLDTLPRLATAAKTVTGEPRVRVFRALGLMARSDETKLVDAVEKAVVELTLSDDEVVAKEATKIFEAIEAGRVARAVRLLERGGLYAHADGAGRYHRVTNKPDADSRFPSPDWNEIDDAVLVQLQYLPDLTFLTLRESGIRDTGLAHVAKVRGLTHLDLKGTKVTDDGLAALELLPNLTYFSLKSPNVTGEGLRHLRKAKGLTALQFCGKEADDEWMAAVEPLRRVGWLELNGTSVTGEGLAAIADWHGLHEVFLNNNKQLDDAGLPYLADKSDLTWVELTHTKITQEGFDAHLRDLPKVKRWGLPKDVKAPKVETE